MSRRLHSWPELSTEEVARFWLKVDKAGGCWVWTGGRSVKGYGVFYLARSGHKSPRSRGAHRVSWEIAHGSIVDSRCVLHRCDNPPCVNPEHLFLGTDAENTADMIAKGRNVRGEACPNARLTEDQILDIRSRVARGATRTSLAREYGVNDTAIGRVVSGRTWKHVLPVEVSR